MIDLTKAKIVEISLGAEGQLWINTENGCQLRIQTCEFVEINDNRQRPFKRIDQPFKED